MPVSRASAAPSPICQVQCLSGRCKMVWPWKPISATWSGVRPGFLEQRLDRLGMGFGQKPFGIADGVGHGRALLHVPGLLQRRPQQSPRVGL